MAVVNLSPPGVDTGTLNGAIFLDTVLPGGGTGLIRSFVRISANTPVVEGYNSSFRPVEFDEDTAAIRNRDLPLAAVPIVLINGVAYREFLLDTNETNPGSLLSLNRVEIYQTAAGGITDYPFVGTATKVFDMDAGTAGMDTASPSPDGNWVLLNANSPAGSGSVNMTMFVPNSVFGTEEFVVLYSRFGDTVGQDDGFEEWAIRAAANVHSISGRKFNDLDGDHTDDGGTDPGLGGWTIFVDANDNGVRDPGEPFTTTAVDGSYTLAGLTAGTYVVCEELQPGWQQTFPVIGDGCHTVILTDADATGFDFGNQLIAPAIDIEKHVAGLDADTAPGPSLPVGSSAVFTYFVTNPGNVPLASVVVVDDNGTPLNPADDFSPTFTGGDTSGDGLLDPGETWTYTAMRTVTLGLFTNLGMVAGTSSVGTVTDSDPANHTGIPAAVAAVDIEKLVNGNDADLPTGPFLAVGSTATFTYLVTNTGNVDLTNVSVVDDQGLVPARGPDQIGNNDNVLDPGEVWVFTASVIVVAGQYTNLGTVTAGSSQGPVTDSDPANHFGVLAAINIEKLVNGQDADTPTGPLVPVGSTVTFTYIVTNGGNTPLSGVTVIDDNGTPGDLADDFSPAFTSGDTNGNGLLDTTEIWTFTAIKIATPGLYTNVGTVTGQTPLATTVTDSDPANHFGVLAVINLEKLVDGLDADTPPGPLVTVGSTVTFTYIVTNGGNVPLAIVDLVDDNGTPGILADDFTPTFTGGDANGNFLLDPTETWTYVATRIVTLGLFTNLATVIAEPPVGTTVTDSDPANHTGVAVAVAAVDLEKFVNGEDADLPTGPFLAVGSTAIFTYLVSNTGNVDLTNVSVVDDQGLVPTRQPDQAGNNDNVLEPGEVWVFTASVIVVPGQYTNIGTVTADTGEGPVTDSDPANHFGVLGGIDIEKLVNGLDADTPPGPIVELGSTVTFTYVVTNTGNVPLANVVVVDDNGTPLNPADDFSPTFTGGDTNTNSLLDLTETWTFTAAKTVTTLGQYTNLGAVTGETPLGTTVTDTDPGNFFGVPMIMTPDKTLRSLPFVHLVDPSSGALLSSFLAYDVNYRGGVRVATADITGDGIPEIITAPGRNAKPIVKIFSLNGTLLEQFLAYPSSFKGGVDLAVGDVNNDGQKDIVTAMSYSGNQVKVFKNPAGPSFDFGTTTTVAKHLSAFTPFGSFKGGASVEVADMGTAQKSGVKNILNTTLDGKPELIVANEAGLRSTVYVYGFLPTLTGSTKTALPSRLRTYLPFTAGYRGGLSLDVMPVDQLDEIPDILVGAKSLGASRVQILNGASTSTAVINGFVAFNAGDTPSINAPLNVVARDRDRDGRAESILVSQGSDGSFGRIRRFDSLTGALIDELLEVDFDPLPVDHFFGAYFTESLKS